MRAVYKVLAYIVAAEVAVQSMSIVFASAGEGKYVEEGGVVNNSLIEADEWAFPEIAGFVIHAVNGIMIIPLLALILLIVSFFTKLPGAAKWAGVVLVLVVVQVALGFIGHSIPAVGALHGLNALILFAVAFHTARRARVVDSRPVHDDASLATSA